MEHCCSPSRTSPPLSDTTSTCDVPFRSQRDAREYVELAGGEFLMGDPYDEGYRTDGERPVHRVEVAPFAITATTVTNTEFAEFVSDTGFVTDAERFGSSAVFHLAVKAPVSDMLGRAPGAPWWIDVRGADWAHPSGSRSHWADAGLGGHPVVHISWHDAVAYCSWAGGRLPTEAEWEFSARGGQKGRRYPWGDELTPNGEDRCNIWHGRFPESNTLSDGFLTTAPVRSFPENDFGLFEVAGNVWEWCADWFSPSYYRRSPRQNPLGPRDGTSRVTRGGSYLCHHSYCNRYRLAARSANTPESSTGNCGFRMVRQ